jgi:hypothetical protein
MSLFVRMCKTRLACLSWSSRRGDVKALEVEDHARSGRPNEATVTRRAKPAAERLRAREKPEIWNAWPWFGL